MKTVFKNIAELVTLESARQKKGRRIQEKDLSIIKNAAIVVEHGKILWCGEKKKLPRAYTVKTKEVDLKGRNVMPGFVECHTHSIYAGTRSQEFELRNRGVSYQEIAARGGGILSTMRNTRQATKASLKKDLEVRIGQFVQQGVTTLEVKTGYGLDLKSEIKCLEVLNSDFIIDVIPTFLGAHAIPPEYKSGGEYLKYLAGVALPLVRKKNLSRRADIFIERGFFNFDEALDYLQVAKDLGFDLTVHADQLSLCGGADAALAMGARSADHLLQLAPDNIQSLAASEVTCVLLPTADLYMKSAYPKARALIEAGARVALATDYNPGSSPTQDLGLVGLLARLEMKMTLPEVISAYTVGAAAALGLQESCGAVVAGLDANFFTTDLQWDQLFYSVGQPVTQEVFVSGKRVFKRTS